VTEGSPGRDSKVAALIDRYGLEGVGAELERRWTAPEEHRDGLRALAELFNRRLLREAMVEAGMDPLEGEPANAYRLLTDDDVTSGIRTETEQRLRREGVDVDRLRGEFVSYQAVRTYLTEVRGVSYDRPESDPEGTRGSIERLVGRTAAVVERRLERLRSAGDLALGSFRVRASVTVYCEDCDSQYRVTELLGRGGCGCERDDGS
jgi:hypothetical protein